jgi:hypothetical protein
MKHIIAICAVALVAAPLHFVMAADTKPPEEPKTDVVRGPGKSTGTTETVETTDRDGNKVKTTIIRGR